MPLPKLFREDLSVRKCQSCGEALVNELERDSVVRRDIWVCPGDCPTTMPVCGRCGSVMTRSTYGGKCPNRCYTLHARLQESFDRLPVE